MRKRSAHVWLPFLFAPVIGGAIGLYMFDIANREPGLDTNGIANLSERESDHQKEKAWHKRNTEPHESNLTGFMAAMQKEEMTQAAMEAEAAFSAILSQPPGAARRERLKSTFTRWALEAPLYALAQMDRISTNERLEIVTAALVKLGTQKPDQFLSYADALGDHYLTYMGGALAVLVHRNPKQALRWANQDKARDPHGALMTAIMPGLIQHDLAAAIDTVSAMKERAPIALVQQVAVAYVKQDPRKANEWVVDLLKRRSDKSPLQALNETGAALASTNPEDAAMYVASIADPVARKNLIKEIANEKAREDLASAWHWLNQYQREPMYSEVTLNLLSRWSYSKPEEVAKILQTLSDQHLQTTAATILSRSWLQRDPHAYKQWLVSLPNGTLKTALMPPQ
jgi:hypothetical protein